MFDFNWPELLIIATVALIVIGPEDLPQMFRQLGRFTSKLRQMSREFSRAMEQAAKDTGVKDVVKDLKASTSSSALGLDAVKNAAERFEKWDPLKNAAKPTTPMPARTLVPPPMPATPPKVVTAADPLAEVLDDADEAADDLAEHAAEAAHGPATQALYDKQALRAQVLKEQTEKLKAIEAGTYTATPIETPQAAKPAPKKRVSKATPAAGVAGADTVADPVKTPGEAALKPRRTPRKPKGEETA
jgi:sec-independent protein translocase protein TatB